MFQLEEVVEYQWKSDIVILQVKLHNFTGKAT